MQYLQPHAVDQLGLSPLALSGQVAIVTGAGRGIGRETALAFTRLGAAVVIAELSDTGAEVEAGIRKAGGKALFVPTDVSDEHSVAALAQETRETFGPANILVNNAILSPVASVLNMEVDQWDRVMSVNLRGAFLTCRAFLPDMLARGKGIIVNMVSLEAMPYLSAYIASKQGLLAFSQSLAAEVGESGVRVIAFGPGFVDTPGLRSTGEGLAPQLGMSPDEFLHMPLHAAYEGAMPAEDAGAATAYLVAALADEYHGETVTGYAVLERAGYLKTPRTSGSGEPGATPDPKPAAHPAKRTQALELARRLREVLEETEVEFGRLPIFVRPLARSGFKIKAGLSLQDWKLTLDRLSKEMQEAGSDLTQEKFQLNDLLGKLARYYREVPEETARFVKDPEVLREIKNISAERLALILEIADTLEGNR